MGETAERGNGVRGKKGDVSVSLSWVMYGEKLGKLPLCASGVRDAASASLRPYWRTYANRTQSG